MHLRNWQVHCVATALERFRIHKHFLCLASPGAGKSAMAAEVGRRLVHSGDIDFILCFAPSTEVAEGLSLTFSELLGRRFDGLIGSIGGAFTYQSMPTLGDAFWSLFEHYRVLAVFDEIHHCAGSTHEDANTWGEVILRLQDVATYTLALTGTPWRSDKRPIVLSRYSDENGQIQCDFIYGMKDAIQDKVCRKPSIVLVDNERFIVDGDDRKPDEFGSIEALLNSKVIKYSHLLLNDAALRHTLTLGCNKLAEIRENNPNAGGLVVASSVIHAQQIAALLRDVFDQTVSVVTYQQDKPSALINEFRHGAGQWIVSVGMVSEGTDIPRLQVCCHLSRVTTELYFRQVLGRIMRVTAQGQQDAWLITFAEPQLVEFTNRLLVDVPQVEVIFDGVDADRVESETTIATGLVNANLLPRDSGELQFGEPSVSHSTYSDSQQSSSVSWGLPSLSCIGRFREMILHLELPNGFGSDAMGRSSADC